MTGQHLVIARGRLDDSELAALTAVLAAHGRQASVAPESVAIQPMPSWVRQAEFAFGNSWMRQHPESGSSRLRVHLENEPPEWEHWAVR